MYIFKCEDIKQEIRGHSRKEIVDMLLEMEDEFKVLNTQNSKTREFLTRLARFINGESADHKKLFALHQEKNILQATKSMHYLEMLTRIKDKIDDLEKDLQNDVREYYKRHPALEQEMAMWFGD